MTKRFLLWLVVAWVLFACALWTGKTVYDRALQQQALNRHHHLIKAARTLVHEHLLTAVQDIQQLSAVAYEVGYLDAPDAVNQERLARIFMETAAIYGRYDQIRIIDLEGRERIRVNNTGLGAVMVPESDLQSKPSRFYVRQGLRLRPGQVYLSPLNLNMERGELEQPFKPTLRLVRMMQNASGNPAGMLVLNLKAAGMMNQFIELFPEGDRAMLLNADGYWMINHAPANEWGWMRDYPELTLENWRPALWQQIQDEDGGSLQLQQDLFSFRWLDIANIYETTSSARYVADLGLISDLRASQWIILVQSAKERWQAGALYLEPWFGFMLAGLMLMIALMVYLLVRNRHQAREQAALKWEQLENFRDLYENAPIGYLTLTRDGLISNVNKRTLEYLGYQREELVNRLHLSDLVDSASQQEAKELLTALSNAEEGYHRIKMNTRRGDTLVMSCSVSSRLSDERTLELGRFSMQNISRQARLEERLKDLAHRDPLTGVGNRRWFDELAERELARAHRTGSPLTLLELDIDHFKKVNDGYGHDAGDEVLKALAEYCRHSLRRTDILARFGGEEFVLLLPDTALEQGMDKAERLRRELAELPVRLADGRDIRFTVSLGAACLSSEHDNIKALLKAADEALYQAKHTGRNRVSAAQGKAAEENARRHWRVLS